MEIRRTEMGDLEEVMAIYSGAREFMRESGNMAQWEGGYPSIGLVKEDIENQKSYVATEGGEILSVFYFAIEEDPTYVKIDGKWLSENPYGVVHRIAKKRGGPGGMGLYCLDWCLNESKNVRIDTHQDNAPMRGLLGKAGYAYCGIIWIEDGSERMAFQKEV